LLDLSLVVNLITKLSLANTIAALLEMTLLIG
jgi:hypothetical protein